MINHDLITMSLRMYFEFTRILGRYEIKMYDITVRQNNLVMYNINSKQQT